MQITENEMYPEDSPFIEKLLTDMATQPIRKVGKCHFHLSPKFSQAKNINFPFTYRGKRWWNTI